MAACVAPSVLSCRLPLPSAAPPSRSLSNLRLHTDHTATRRYLSTSSFPDACRFSSLRLRATSSSEDTSSSIQADELISSLKEKWDALEDKSTVFIYGGGAVVAVWLSSIVVGAIDSVPLLPKVMELVGLGYTGWFVYRYLLFKSSRKELANDIEDIKKKITGTGE